MQGIWGGYDLLNECLLEPLEPVQQGFRRGSRIRNGAMRQLGVVGSATALNQS
jgi:hypothetical protein